MLLSTGIWKKPKRSSTPMTEVDDLFEEIKAELIGMIHQDADCGAQAVDFLMISKYFERIVTTRSTSPNGWCSP